MSKKINKKKDTRENEVEDFYESDEFVNSEEYDNSDQSESSDSDYSQSGGDGDELEVDEADNEADNEVDDEVDDEVGDDEVGDDESSDEVDDDEVGDDNEVGDDEVVDDNVGDDVDSKSANMTKSCYLKNLNKDFIVMDEDDSNIYGKMEYKKIPDNERETDPIMTYYEMVRIIGLRAQQFDFGAKPLIKGIEGMHTAKMAYLELIAKMTPFIIRRPLPGKKYEDWRIDELEIIRQINDKYFVPDNFDMASLMKYTSKLNSTTSSNNKFNDNYKTKNKSKKNNK